MKVNGEAIYGTTASPFKRLPWGRCTKKVAADGTTLYLHVFDWPADGKLVVPGLKNKVGQAWLLADPDKKPLKCEMSEDGAVISVPTAAPDPICSVVVCQAPASLDVVVPPLMQSADGSVVLPAVEAVLHGDQIKFESAHKQDNIGSWTKAEDWVEWEFKIDKPGKFNVSAMISNTAASRCRVTVGEKRFRADIPASGDFKKYVAVELGSVEISEKGVVKLGVHPARRNWQPINLSSVTLKPAN